MKRYDSYKDSGFEWIGDIPSHWERLNLGNVFTVKGRIGWKNLRSDEYIEEPNYIFLSTPNLKSKEIDFINVNYITKERYDESPEIMLENDDILLVKSGSTLGIVNIIKNLPKPSSVNGSSVVLRKRNKSEIGTFYNYLLGSNYFQNLMKVTQGGVGVPSVNQSDIRKFNVLKPPLSEQQQIVSFLDTKTSLIDSLIEKTQQKIELLKEKRTSLINETVTKGLNPNVEMKDSGVEWIGEIPNHWKKSKFKFHSEIVTGNTPSKKKEELYYTDDKDGLPWVKPTRLDQGFDFVFKSDQYLTDEGQNETRVIPKNSIMVCSIGNTLGKFGISGCEMSTNQQINSVICDENSLFHRFCLFFVSVLTEDLIKWTNFVTLPIFTKSDFEVTEIIIPPLSEQQQIVEYLDEQTQLIDNTISIEEKRIELLKEYRQSLISEVVTGKRKVTN